MNPTFFYMCCSISILLFSSTFGSVLFVDKNNSMANDTNSGLSRSNPILTIAMAVSKANSGDSVVVQSGTYSERITTKKSGGANNPIAIIASGPVATQGFVINHSNISIDGFQISGNVTNQYDGAILIGTAASFCEIRHCKIYNLSSNIGGIVFSHGGTDPSLSAQHITFSNDTIKNILYTGISFYGGYHVFQGCAFDNLNGFDAIRMAGRNTTVKNNIFLNLTEIGGNHTDIIQCFGETGDVAYNIIFECNYIKNCNVCQICNLSADGVADIRDWTFRNNVFDSIGAVANVGIPGVNWYNNVFYKCVRNAGHVISVTSGSTGIANSCNIFNNIFYECGSNPSTSTYGWYETYIYTGYPQLVGFKANYNFVCGTYFSPKNTSSGSAFIFSELNGINGGDPRFIGTGNLSLSPASPLIDKGINLDSTGFNYDFNGTQRPQNKNWDIGAFEVLKSAIFHVKRFRVCGG
jgi:hypothetical protein